MEMTIFTTFLSLSNTFNSCVNDFFFQKSVRFIDFSVFTYSLITRPSSWGSKESIRVRFYSSSVFLIHGIFSVPYFQSRSSRSKNRRNIFNVLPFVYLPSPLFLLGFISLFTILSQRNLKSSSKPLFSGR